MGLGEGPSWLHLATLLPWSHHPLPLLTGGPVLSPSFSEALGALRNRPFPRDHIISLAPPPAQEPQEPRRGQMGWEDLSSSRCC